MLQLLLILHSGIAVSGKIKRILQIPLLVDISGKHSLKNQSVLLQHFHSSMFHYAIIFLSVTLLVKPSISLVKMGLFVLLINMHVQNVYNHTRDVLILSLVSLLYITVHMIKILTLILIGDDPAAIVGLDEGQTVPVLHGEDAELAVQDAEQARELANEAALGSGSSDDMEEDGEVSMVVIDGIVMGPTVCLNFY